MPPRDPRSLALLMVVLTLGTGPQPAAASEPGAGTPALPVEKPLPEPPPPTATAAVHPQTAAGPTEPAEPLTLSFADAAAETAAAGETGGFRSHVQGTFDQVEPGHGGVALPPELPLPPASAPPEDGGLIDPLAPGDSVGQFTGLSNTGWIPPDTILAAGPASLVEAVNSGFAVYSKAGGTLQGYTTFSFFFSPLLPAGWQGSLFDPRVLYSPSHSKFVLLALGRDAVNQDSFFFIAVSQTTDPTGLWWGYRFAADDPNPADSDAWADYCGLGADPWGIYVTCNMFQWIGGFKHGKLWSLDPGMFSGGAGSAWGFWDLRWNSGSAAFSLQPAAPYSLAADQATFFVNTFSSSGSSVLLWKLTGDRTNSPTLTRSTIGTLTYNAIGENVDQPGSSSDIDGGDARILNAAYKDRRVYAVLTHDVANDGRKSGWLLLKLDVDAQSLDWQHLLWTSTPAATGGFYYFYPAITLDGGGGAVPNLAVYGSWTDSETSVTASTQYASGLFKIYTDQSNSGAGPFIGFSNGLAPYVRRDSADRNRWGDYSGAAYDWSTGDVWGAVEVADTGNTWRTVIRGNEISAGCTPDAFEPDDGSGQASPIASGSPQAHNVCPAGDEDWVTFSLGAESAVTLETSGPAGDTRMWLFDSGLGQVEFDDDSGTDLFSLIDRTCGNDALPAGTYFVKVDEFGDDDEIAAYNLSFSIDQACGGCTNDLTFSNTILAGVQTHRAASSITLGPSLVVSGSPIRMIAGQSIVMGSGTEIGGSFSAQIDPNPCSVAAPEPEPTSGVKDSKPR